MPGGYDGLKNRFPMDKSSKDRTPDVPDHHGAKAFDAVAHGYDAGFSHTMLGRMMRERVWILLSNRVGELSRATTSILEINCGTGEDAIWFAKQGGNVLATDVSAEMIAVAKAKLSERL